jgi:hypothetical protein
MNRFQLFLSTSDPDLFRKATSELGTIFYRWLTDKELEIVYFSSSRIARFTGAPDDKLKQFVHACGHEASIIELDEFSGTLKIMQKEAV